MTSLVFVDTDVLVYARDPRDATQRSFASEWIRMLWTQERGRTSVQVLGDYYDLITRRFRPAVSREDAWDDVQHYLSSWNPRALDSEVLDRARDIEASHHLGWGECLVVAAAQLQDCVLLLSASLPDRADYGGVIVRSPFTLQIAEESGAYPLPQRPPSRHRGRGRPRRAPSHDSDAGS